MPTKKRKPRPRAAIQVHKHAFPKWLGKKRDSITAADIVKGKASDDSPVVKVATFAANSKKRH